MSYGETKKTMSPMENPLAGISPEQDAAEKAQAARALKEELRKKEDELYVSATAGQAAEEAKKIANVESALMSRVAELKKQADESQDPLGLAQKSYEQAKRELDEFRRKGLN